MKEVLIYGALVAAVMGAAIPLISNFTATTNTQGAAINAALTAKSEALIKSLG